MKAVSANRIKIARAVAIGADILQWVLFPLIAAGIISPLDDALDVIVCIILTWLVGWHYSFLPSFIVKVVPLADIIPTWTIAVLLATRKRREPPIVPGSTEVYVDPPAVPRVKWSGDK